MGTNTLATQSDGTVINADDPNQFKTALTQDLVPRNATGVATDIAGGLGTSALRWGASYLKNLFFGAAASLNELSEDGSSNPIIKRNGSTVATFDSNGITRDSFSSINYATSSNTGNYTVTSTVGSADSVCNATITTSGNPVLIVFAPTGTGASTWPTSFTNTAGLVSANGSVYLGLKRGSTVIQILASGDTTADTHNNPCSMVCYDHPSAGTYTYYIEATRSGTFSIKYYQLHVYEL